MATNYEHFQNSKDDIQQLEERFSCSVCLDRYVKPRTLPCSHTFCHSCLVDSLRTFKNRQRFYCPFCRTNAKVEMNATLTADKVVERFPLDFNLIQMMKTASSNTDPETDSSYCKPCLRDKTFTAASVYCCECCEILCSDCKKHHSRNKQTTSHTVVDIKGDMGETRRLNFVKSLTKCKNHPQEEVKYLCKDHDQLCCNECAILSHRQCQTLQSLSASVTSGFQNLVTKTLQAMEKHVEKMKSREINHMQSVANSEIMIKDQLLCIKTEFDNAFSVFEDQMLREVKLQCNSMRNSISSQQMSINKFEADLKRAKEKVSSVEQYGQDLHIYLIERKMEEEMKQNEQVLKHLHQNTSCSEISLTGVETISERLFMCLKHNLSVTVNGKSVFPFRNVMRGGVIVRDTCEMNFSRREYWEEFHNN